MAFSPDGRHLATDSRMSDVVRVWTLDVDELRRWRPTGWPATSPPPSAGSYLRRACDNDD